MELSKFNRALQNHRLANTALRLHFLLYTQRKFYSSHIYPVKIQQGLELMTENENARVFSNAYDPC